MRCKYCGAEIKADETVVSYKISEWRGAGGYNGSYEYMKEEITDAGVFCCDKCLWDYLNEKS